MYVLVVEIIPKPTTSDHWKASFTKGIWETFRETNTYQQVDSPINWWFLLSSIYIPSWEASNIFISNRDTSQKICSWSKFFSVRVQPILEGLCHTGRHQQVTRFVF